MVPAHQEHLKPTRTVETLQRIVALCAKSPGVPPGVLVFVLLAVGCRNDANRPTADFVQSICQGLAPIAANKILRDAVGRFEQDVVDPPRQESDTLWTMKGMITSRREDDSIAVRAPYDCFVKGTDTRTAEPTVGIGRPIRTP